VNLIKLLLQKESKLTKKDVQDMVRIKDLYAFGLAIIDVLQAKTQRPAEQKVREFDPEHNAVPVKWAKMDQGIHII